MRKETLMAIKRSYKSLQEEQKKFKLIWDRIEELEKDDLIKEYIELKKEVQRIDPQKKYLTSEEILEICINSYLFSQRETNDIYVDVGITTIQKNNNTEEYKRYINLESMADSKLIPIELTKEFERNNQVIKAGSKERYSSLQKEFLETSMEEGQDKACTRVLTKEF